VAAAVASLVLALAAPALRAQESTVTPDTTGYIPPRKNALRAIGEITFINTAVWSYNRYIRPGGGEGFKIGWTSWNESFENGFDWDPNNFSTNQFAHPYHGNLYFNAGRSNGFSYWESMGFAFMGSWQWEFLGEARHPSVNDWVNTSLGGTALGEMTHRLATTVRDNTATGGDRFWHEFGGFFIDPAGGLTRFLSGDMFKVQPNPDDRFPTHVGVEGTFGLRTTYIDHIPQSDTTGWIASFRFAYGDPFQPRFRKPYEHFSAYVQLNGKEENKLGQVDVAGMLARRRFSTGGKAEHILGAYQHYDYLNNRAFELGGQSFSAGLNSRFGAPGSRYKVVTGVYVAGVVLAATKSDYENQTARSYDYGPGFGTRFNGALVRDGWDILRLGHDQYYIHSVNGNRADHFLSMSYLGVSIPLGPSFALGGDYQLYLADRNYADFPDVEQRSPQVQAYLRAKL
jgi:hypothetical protein